VTPAWLSDIAIRIACVFYVKGTDPAWHLMVAGSKSLQTALGESGGKGSDREFV